MTKLPAEAPDLLDQLASVLERQLGLARDGQYEAMSELSQQAGDLMGRLARDVGCAGGPSGLHTIVVPVDRDGVCSRTAAAHPTASADPPPQAPPTMNEQLTRLRNLHRRLALTLAAEQQELGERLAHSRRGSKALRGYGRTAEP